MGFFAVTGSKSDEIPSSIHPYIPDTYEKSVAGSSVRARSIYTHTNNTMFHDGHAALDIYSRTVDVCLWCTVGKRFIHQKILKVRSHNKQFEPIDLL